MAPLLFLLTLVLALAGAAPAAAQTTGAGPAQQLSPSLASSTEKMHATIRQNLAEAADGMSAEEYSFRPTPQVRTFAQLLGHVINTNRLFCSQAVGEKPPAGRNYEEVADKATLVNALHEALAACDKAYGATTDANFSQPVTVGSNTSPTTTTRGALLIFNTTHNNEHYGNMVVYLRLKNHVPPSTARTQQPQR
jgi:uncharacterized damage-inducible protein DinB